MTIANGIKESTTTTGTGAVTLTVLSGFARFSQAFSVGLVVNYAINNGVSWEWGRGTVGAGNTLSRTVIFATLVGGVYTTSGATPINLVGTSDVMCVDLAEYRTITGGTINGTPIGGTTQAAIAATTISATGDVTLSGANPRVAFSTTTGNSGLSNNVGGATILHYGGSHATKANETEINGNVVRIQTAAVDRAVISFTGLAVTGAISATAAITNSGLSDGITTRGVAGVSSRANIITSGTNAASAELAGYFGVNIFDTSDTIQIGAGGAAIKISQGAGGAVSIPLGGGLAVTGAISATATIASGGYTVATLPAGTVGQRAYVTDATAPTYLGALTGGGAVNCPVYRNATAWVSA